MLLLYIEELHVPYSKNFISTRMVFLLEQLPLNMYMYMYNILRLYISSFGICMVQLICDDNLLEQELILRTWKSRPWYHLQCFCRAVLRQSNHYISFPIFSSWQKDFLSAHHLFSCYLQEKNHFKWNTATIPLLNIQLSVDIIPWTCKTLLYQNLNFLIPFAIHQ